MIQGDRRDGRCHNADDVTDGSTTFGNRWTIGTKSIPDYVPIQELHLRVSIRHANGKFSWASAKTLS